MRLIVEEFKNTEFALKSYRSGAFPSRSQISKYNL